MDVINTLDITDWHQDFNIDLQTQAIETVERGKLLYLPKLNFVLQSQEKRFLSATYTNPKNKNISFDAKTDQIKGVHGTVEDQKQLKIMLKRFASQAKNLIQAFFPNYISALEIGRTSFRPVEISCRETSFRKDDTRLHIDAFPSSPNQGKRILRVFSNVNPDQDRIWRIGEPFEEVAKRFLPKVRKPFPVSSFLLKTFRITKSKRTAYDHIMLHIHDAMKADLNYQKTVPQIAVRFPAASSWIVMTDHVSHAAMSGQHALEQTFYLPISAMSDPNRSPLRVLERLLGTLI